MSFIQFESARDKERIRQELREARTQMLEQAKQRAEKRAEREVVKELKGEKNWMLPEVSKKLDKLNKTEKTSSKKSKKHKRKKKLLKKQKKRKRDSSTSDSEIDESSDTVTEERGASGKHKKGHKKHRRKRKVSSSSDSDDSSSSGSGKKRSSSTSSSTSNDGNRKAEEWIDRKSEVPLKRDTWMTASDDFQLKTFSRERAEKKPDEKQHASTYNPQTSGRELNPYWKSTGTGLPGFQKPKGDSDDEVATSKRSSAHLSSTQASKKWQKQSNAKSEAAKCVETIKSVRRISTHSSASEGGSDDEKKAKAEDEGQYLTDQQMNELGAKLLKAEIMGNKKLATELKIKLEQAREKREAIKQQRGSVKTPEKNAIKQKSSKRETKQDEEHILLTHTDSRGNSRPLMASGDLYGGRSAGGRNKSKRAETHVAGERVRYFPDDDKYDIKQMFEREKYTTAAEANLAFANVAGKHKNPNDDLEDIFADKARKCIDPRCNTDKEYQRAVYDQQRMSAKLDSCDKCFDSPRMRKDLIVSMGEKVYLSLPWHVGLQGGHCLLVPTQHVSCCTLLDEDAWQELTDFRKALTRMYAAQHKDVVFFEIANNLQRRPHVSVHCVPIAEKYGEIAPFYFKKAIEESEREWSVNKQLITLREKGLRNSIPKGLPYFWVHFGVSSGFAHVIEEENRFPLNFALEILGGLLELDVNKWRRPQKEQNHIAKVKMFADSWKKYDCTK